VSPRRNSRAGSVRATLSAPKPTAAEQILDRLNVASFQHPPGHVTDREGAAKQVSQRDMMLTPTIAQEWLSDTPYAAGKTDRVKQLAKLMKAGDWRGRSVIVLTQGKHGPVVADGESRCRAVP
jgi:hypothetical protein